MKEFAKATGQLWKYRVWQVVSLATAVITVAFLSLWRGNPAKLPEDLTIALYFPICIFWFAWWAAAIRCPACGVRLTWYQMRHGDGHDAVVRISETDVCPACCFDPAGSGGLTREMAGEPEAAS